eukprot:418678-Amphidinium_carterae.1
MAVCGCAISKHPHNGNQSVISVRLRIVTAAGDRASQQWTLQFVLGNFGGRGGGTKFGAVASVDL